MWRKRLKQHRRKPFLLVFAPTTTPLVNWLDTSVLVLVFTDISLLKQCVRYIRWYGYDRYWCGLVLAGRDQDELERKRWQAVIEVVSHYRRDMSLPCWVWLYQVEHLPPEAIWPIACEQGLGGGARSLLAVLRQQMPLRCQWYDEPIANSCIAAVVPHVKQQIQRLQHGLQQVWMTEQWQKKIPLRYVLLDAECAQAPRLMSVVKPCLALAPKRPQRHRRLKVCTTIFVGMVSLLWLGYATQRQWQVWDNALLHAKAISLSVWQHQDAQLQLAQWSWQHQPYQLWHAAYQYRLQQDFLPKVIARLHHVLLTKPTFIALKLYLMLSIGKHINKAWVMQHIQPYWQVGWQARWLNDALSLPHYPGVGDAALIARLRRQWQTKSLVSVMWQNLQRQAKQHLPRYVWLPASSPGTTAFVTSPLTVPGLFSEVGYRHFFRLKMKNQIQHMAQSTWVLGWKHPASSAQTARWHQALIKQYWQSYLTHWQNMLAALRLKPFPSLSMTVFRLRQFSSSDNIWSALWMKFAIQMAHFPAFFPGYQHAQWQQWHTILKKLATRLEGVLDSGQSDQKNWQWAKQLFSQHPPAIWQTLDETISGLKPPLRNWLVQIRQRVLAQIVQGALSYSKQQWQQNVMPYFQQNLKSYFPFALHAQQDVSLAAMHTFFNPKTGVLSTFLHTYLQPFMRVTNLGKIKWKTQYGLTIKQDVHWLRVLQALLWLQRGWFEQNQLRWVVPIRWQDLSSISNVTLSIGKKHWHANAGQVVWRLLWPGSLNTRLIWSVNPGWLARKHSMNWQGPWAIWHWLHTTHAIQNGKQWLLHFHANGRPFSAVLLTTPRTQAVTCLLFKGWSHVLP